MQRHFLLDASALIPFFLDIKDERMVRAAILKLLSLRDQNKAVLWVPNFCLAECSKAFAARLYSHSSSAEGARNRYRQAVEKMLDIVSSSRKGLIRSLNLERAHLVAIEDVFNAQWAMNPRSEGLSGFDGLVLTMARDLLKKYGTDSVRLVTNDRWMATVCKQNPDLLPHAVLASKEPIPDG